MKKTLLCVMAGAALLGGAATEARSQEMEMMMNRRAPRFDFGVYAGGAVSSRWYESSLNVPTDFEGDLEDDEGVAYKIGYAPIFGANATYWATPMFGVRAHYGYMPSKPPIASDGFFDIFQEWEDGLPLNNHFYDLNLVFRPFVMRPDVSSTLSSVYFFVGGGGLTTDHASGFLDEIGDGNDLGPELDENDFDGFDICEPGALSRGVCFPLEGDNATVGQGVVGAGIDLLGFGDTFALFGETAVHGYDSPVHTSPGFTGFPESEAVEDEFAFTTRIVAGVKYLVGNILPPPPPVVPVAPEPLPPPPPPVAPVTQPIRVCVVQGPAIVEVDAVFDPATGDTAIVVEGVERPFAQVYPATAPEYAAGQQFFINNEEITVMDQRYVRFGLPRVVTPTDVVRVGEFQGVGVFAEAGAATPPQVIYLPVRPGCEFQPYQQAEEVGRVRG